MNVSTVGRRERKKAQTRQALADAALTLFLAHGYENVTVAQIAEAADVSLATVFKHVPDGKQALIFDDGAERRAAVVAAVRDREAGVTVLSALRQFMHGRGPYATDMDVDLRRKRDLILVTSELRDYQRRLWLTATEPLADAIAEATGGGVEDPAIVALTRFVLEIPDLTGDRPDPLAALDAVFDLLENGARQSIDDRSARDRSRS